MADRIMGYYWSPYAPLEAEHVLIVFSNEDVDGSYLAYSPTSGICRLRRENEQTWHKLKLRDFMEAVEGIEIPTGFLRGAGAVVNEAEEVCREWTTRINRRRDLEQPDWHDR